MSSKEIEKKSLEAHVELCAERYENLEHKLSNLTGRMDKMEMYLMDIRNTLLENKSSHHKTIITIGTSILAVLLAAIIAILATPPS